MARFGVVQTPLVRVVPFERRHLHDTYVGWLNDPEIVYFSEQRHRRHTRESCQGYLDSFAASDDFFCAIETVEAAERHIGNITVTIDRSNGVADIAILIGDRSIWGRGYGTHAWGVTMNALFDAHGFRKVTGGTAASNRGMIAVMRKAAMVEDGRRLAQFLIAGEPVDAVYYAAFAAAGQRWRDTRG